MGRSNKVQMEEERLEKNGMHTANSRVAGGLREWAGEINKWETAKLRLQREGEIYLGRLCSLD